MNREAAIALMIRLEGGEVNAVGDPGGHTKYGIIQRTLDAVRPTIEGLPANVADLTEYDAAEIYRGVQWVHIRGNDLAPPLACLVLNAAVNLGEPRAIMLLQKACGIPVDGSFGAQTLNAVNAWRSKYQPDQTLAQEYAVQVAVWYASLYGRLGQFEVGWLRRLFLVYHLAVFT